jgi:hypothetical protein
MSMVTAWICKTPPTEMVAAKDAALEATEELHHHLLGPLGMLLSSPADVRTLLIWMTIQHHWPIFTAIPSTQSPVHLPLPYRIPCPRGREHQVRRTRWSRCQGRHSLCQSGNVAPCVPWVTKPHYRLHGHIQVPPKQSTAWSLAPQYCRGILALAHRHRWCDAEGARLWRTKWDG